jgi:5-methyltetrahydrofolate--homocysteine methyltransferase
MRQVVELIRKEEGDKIKVVIGGAPVTQDYANEINADGYAPDAASSVDLIQSLLAA